MNIKTLLTLLLATLCTASGYGQTLKALMYNTTNGQVVYNGTNRLTFTNNDVELSGLLLGGTTNTLGIYDLYAPAAKFEEIQIGGYDLAVDENGNLTLFTSLFFNNTTNAATTRTNLGLGATWLTNTNVTNFRTAIGLGDWGTRNDGAAVRSENLIISDGEQLDYIQFTAGEGVQFHGNRASQFRTALGIATNQAVQVSGFANSGDFTNNNGTIFGLKTNVGPFEGIGNFLASNNTTLSNETLFRVGVAEATNRSAQFGFRVARTNNGGEGFAVFSVYGYNALMMIGPSDRSRTNTATNAGIEADIWTITPTNRVATLRDTNSGAFTLHQELGFSTGGITTNAPANTTNVALWLRVWVGTNNYRLPLYQ